MASAHFREICSVLHLSNHSISVSNGCLSQAENAAWNILFLLRGETHEILPPLWNNSWLHLKRGLYSWWESTGCWPQIAKVKVKSEVAQSRPTLCDPRDWSLSGSSVHGIFQARVLEWIAISFYRGSSRPRNPSWVSCIAGRRFTVWATREAKIAKVHIKGMISGSPDSCIFPYIEKH